MAWTPLVATCNQLSSYDPSKSSSRVGLPQSLYALCIVLWYARKDTGSLSLNDLLAKLRQQPSLEALFIVIFEGKRSYNKVIINGGQQRVFVKGH